MANVFANTQGGALSYLRAALNNNAGTTVAYKRGQSTSAITVATPTKPERLVDLEATAPNETTDLDWLVTAADLTIGGDAIMPRAGDRITATIGGVVMIFEVTPRDNLPCYDWHDSFQTMFLIRTKRVRNG